jgi:phosphatidylserine/phosphatidylglycerophosphate/cardiolipin synthase-like enzyme
VNEALLALSSRDVREIAAALRAGRLSPPLNSVALLRVLPATAAGAVAADLQELASRGFNPAQLASALDLLVEDRARRRTVEDAVELVTSGPEAPGVTNRDTAVVVRELFAHAERSVLVAGYAVYQGRQVFRALADRMHERQQLKVRLFLDVRRGPGDTSAAGEVVRRFVHQFRTREWPPDRTVPEVFYDPRALDASPQHRASLHAKCVVVDAEAVFVSSANFTEAAQNRNVEVGLLIRSELLADRLARHFEALTEEGVLTRAF